MSYIFQDGAGVKPFRASLSFDIPPLAGDEVQDEPLPHP